MTNLSIYRASVILWMLLATRDIFDCNTRWITLRTLQIESTASCFSLPVQCGYPFNLCFHLIPVLRWSLYLRQYNTRSGFMASFCWANYSCQKESTVFYTASTGQFFWSIDIFKTANKNYCCFKILTSGAMNPESFCFSLCVIFLFVKIILTWQFMRQMERNTRNFAVNSKQ